MCILLFIHSLLLEWTLLNDLEKYVNELSVPFDTSSLLVIVWSLVNLTLWCATTQVAHRYSTQFKQNPTASVLSLQVMQIWGREQKKITFRYLLNWLVKCYIIMLSRSKKKVSNGAAPAWRCVLTWADLSTVLLGGSTESITKTFSITSTSIHSCLHTGQRITFTGRKRNYAYYSVCWIRPRRNQWVKTMVTASEIDSDSRCFTPSAGEFVGTAKAKFLVGAGKHFLQKECRHGRSLGSRL